MQAGPHLSTSQPVVATAPSAAAATHEDTPKLSPAQTADVKIAYARTLEQQGAHERAMAIYVDALKLDPSRADAFGRLAVLYDQQGKSKEAADMYNKALAADPKNPDLHCNLGYSYYLRSDWTKAEASLRQALALAPNHSRAHNNLGMVLAHTGHCNEALAEFRRAGCSQADADVNLGFALTLEQRLPEAHACYEHALAADPSSAAAKKGLQELDRIMLKMKAAPKAHARADWNPVPGGATSGADRSWRFASRPASSVRSAAPAIPNRGAAQEKGQDEEHTWAGEGRLLPSDRRFAALPTARYCQGGDRRT
jgi:Flp pilus assembly protein TadD